jgi:LPXTG-motif cell wall-anchored protein
MPTTGASSLAGLLVILGLIALLVAGGVWEARRQTVDD